jgi:hypothetical protein
MTSPESDPLQDALDLEVQIRRLRALLELQRQQIEILNDKLYSDHSGGVAAKRLLTLKQREAAAPEAPRRRSR